MPKILKLIIRRKVNVVVKVILINKLFILMRGNYFYNNLKIIKILIKSLKKFYKLNPLYLFTAEINPLGLSHFFLFSCFSLIISS